MVETNRRVRRGYLLLVLCLILLWSFVPWVMGSDLGLHYKNYPILTRISLPALLTTWPAAQLKLDISGPGHGANVRPPATFWSLLLFQLQAMLIWTPALMACHRSFKCWPLIATQCMLLLILSITFWQFGNG